MYRRWSGRRCVGTDHPGDDVFLQWAQRCEFLGVLERSGDAQGGPEVAARLQARECYKTQS